MRCAKLSAKIPQWRTSRLQRPNGELQMRPERKAYTAHTRGSPWLRGWKRTCSLQAPHSSFERCSCKWFHLPQSRRLWFPTKLRLGWSSEVTDALRYRFPRSRLRWTSLTPCFLVPRSATSRSSCRWCFPHCFDHEVNLQIDFTRCWAIYNWGFKTERSGMAAKCLMSSSGAYVAISVNRKPQCKWERLKKRQLADIKTWESHSVKYVIP